MAMPSGNLVVSDKMQFPNGAVAAGGGGEIHHPWPWFPDERDGFISWLRAEFAAANAIIDSLCHHLRVVGELGEYDVVIGCLQQRRGAWNPVLHMQQYFPITEIMLALQQVTWRRQQRLVDQGKVGGKEFKRSSVHSFGSRPGQRAETTQESCNLSVDSQNLNANAYVAANSEKKGAMKEREEAKLGNDGRKSDDKVLSEEVNISDPPLKSQVDSSFKTSRNTDGTNYPCTESASDDSKDSKSSNSKGSCNLLAGKNGDAIQNLNEESPIILPKTFSAMETSEGKMVNVTEGLNLYEKLLDEEEVSKLNSLVNDLRATGRRGQLPGPTFVVSKRPYRGHGREMIQLGDAISVVPPDDNPAKDRGVAPIPGLLQGIIDRLINMQLMPLKPDSCIIDIFNEGDHSQPNSFPFWYGRPICLLSLNDCDMVFGATIAGDRPGIYRGALRLTLTPGSLLVMQGNCTDIARRAIPSIRKQRILITFLKSQPSKAFQGESQRLHMQAAQGSNGGPSSRPTNHIRPKHYTAAPTTGVLPAPPIRAQLPPPNGIPPLFVPPPVPTPMAFPASVPLPPGSAGWPAAASRHATPRLPVPGTGVFLPPSGSGSSPPPLEVSAAVAEISSTQETAPHAETGNGDGNVNGNICCSLKGSSDVKPQQQECNGGADGSDTGKVMTKEDQQQSVDSKTPSEMTGTA